jgi:hypothetical protein
VANPWFRLYTEFAHDTKVQLLPHAMQRHLIMLFCLKGSGELETLLKRCQVVPSAFHERSVEQKLAFALRISEKELAETKGEFEREGFIDGSWNLLNWEKRQYRSDVSTERVHRFREANKKRREDSVKRFRNVSETACNGEDTDTDTEHKKTIASNGNGHHARFAASEIESVYQQYPRKTAKAAALKAIKKSLENLDEEDPVAALRARVTEFANSPAGRKGEFVPYPATWFNRKQYLDDPKEWEK